MKATNYILIIMFMAVVCSLLVSSYQIGENNLQFTCRINEGIPSNAATYNISIYYQNGSTILNNVETTSQGQGSFNYSVNLPVPDTYTIKEFCYDGSLNSSNIEYLTVNPTGTELTSGKGILYSFFMILALGVFLLCLYWAIKIPFANQRDEDGKILGVNQLKYVKVFLISLCYVEFLFIMGLARGITANFVYEVGLDKFFYWAYTLLLRLMWPIIVLTLISWVVLYVQDEKLQKRLERGIDVR